MPFPPVVVYVGPPPVPPELATTLVAACSEAVPSGSCVLAGHGRASERPRAVVHVSWQQPGQRRAELRIVVGGSREARRVARTLTFRDADAMVERWRAVGFAIGALVGVQEGAADRSPGAEVRGADQGDEAAQAEPEQHPVWIGLGGLTAPGVGGGTWRFGGWLRADYSFDSVPLLVTLAGSYAVSPEDDRGLNASWLTIGAGAGAFLNVPAVRLGLRFRAEVLTERLELWAQDPATGVEDSGARWTVGPRLGLHAIWPYDSVVAGVVGATAWTLSDDTAIRMRGQDIDSVPWAAFSLQVGARLGVP